MRPQLRLFTGDEETLTFPHPQVRMRLGDVSQILADASRWNRTWLADFQDDEIEVSQDLYEVLSAYLEMRPGA
jgi:hypothetical protein